VRRPPVTFALFAPAACGPAAPAIEPPARLAPPSSPTPRPLSINDDPPAAARITADVAYLASPELAGRGTGEEGARLAADYIAKRFAELRLLPYGDRDDHAPPQCLQAFQARVGAKVKEADLAVDPKPRSRRLAVGGPVIAADGTASATAMGKGVFVGYGITATGIGWDDYAGADLTGKIAFILDGTPPHRTQRPRKRRRRQAGCAISAAFVTSSAPHASTRRRVR
jgi:hypothetical protein